MFEKKYFGLTENPFNLTPDPKFLYLSPVHKEALAHLQYGIVQRKGFILLTGEVGAGKTTVCRALLADLTNHTRTALILNPSLSDVELLQSINQEFGLDATAVSKKALLDDLNSFLLSTRAQDQNAVLIIDECQNLSPDVLEQIRMLSNLETEKEKLLQIIMIGQPELNAILAAPSLRQINDRIVLRYHMGLLGLADTRDYIAHRLMISGAHGDLKFTRTASRLIYAYSHGLPRKINAAAERSLLIAYLKGSHTITRKMVAEALKELKGEYRQRSVYPRYALGAAAAALVCLFFAAFFNPAVFTGIMGENDGLAKTHDVGKPAKEFQIRRDDWLIKNFTDALELLRAMTGSQAGNLTLNLHPGPDYLKDLDRPFIATIAGGYCVVNHASQDAIWLTGRDKALIEIPLSKFKGLYRWNILARYTRVDAPEIFRMGDKGDRIKWIQTVLKTYGYLSIMPNGIYGVETATGIERLQEAYGLRRDGVAGSETVELIKILGRGPG